ncbi:hypothetical protein A5634_18350 [Mycobacterium asiaticum]|uniref:PE domain-containing protein n=1 Tax=Mycobacterium asiaticum TaxID=1790 RepID=A0A1A3P5P3_MYCAS|nr:PE family protein [Mycobacterium asiaticum]OBK29563.1 hypothetical protein A5634_18350 [Mycobacterium asiaticum]
MSYVVTVPELVTTAAEGLAGVGSTIQQATAAAATPTTTLAAAAADEVSAGITQVFGSYGREFQAISARVATFHEEFVRLLNQSAAAYVATDIATAGQGLANAVNAPARSLLGQATGGLRALEAAVQPLLWTPSAAAATAPGGAYGQLVANTATNLQALGNSWAADPFPFLRQFLANQQGYAQQISTALAGAIQNFPANLANLPTAAEAAIRQLLSFNAAAFAQQFVATQLGFAQTFFTSAANGISGLVAGLPNFASGLQVAFQQLLAGNYTGAVSDLGRAFIGLLVNGVNPGQVNLIFDIPNATITAGVNPTLIGPLGDLFTIMNIPGQEAQYLTNLLPPSIPRQMAQNLTNVLNTLTVPIISAQVILRILAGTAELDPFFGLPLIATYAAAGAPLSTLNAIATSAETIQQALATGNYLGAAGTLFDLPAVALNGSLNGNIPIDTTINVPTGLDPNFLPTNVEIVLHLPSDGILVPPHPATATIVVPSSPLFPSATFPVTILGTPFSGLVPLLVNYAPQQLAMAIRPA